MLSGEKGLGKSDNGSLSDGGAQFDESSLEMAELLMDALFKAKSGDIQSLSLITVDSDNRVSHNLAGKMAGTQTALNGGLVSQLFYLNGKVSE